MTLLRLLHSGVDLLAAGLASLQLSACAELVVTPGCSLPLLVSNSRAHWALEQALSAPAPLTGLLAVVRLLCSAGLVAWSALSCPVCPVCPIWPLLLETSSMHRAPEQTRTLRPFLSQASWQSVSSSSM